MNAFCVRITSTSVLRRTLIFYFQIEQLQETATYKRMAVIIGNSEYRCCLKVWSEHAVQFRDEFTVGQELNFYHLIINVFGGTWGLNSDQATTFEVSL